LSKFSFGIVEMEENTNTVNQTVDPDIFVLSKKLEKIDFKLIKDDICEKKLRNYINLSLKKEENMQFYG